MTTEWSTTTRYIAGVSLVLLGIFILYISRAVIPLLIVATLVAVIVRPLIMWLQQAAHLSRGLSVALVYLLVAILVPVVVMLAFPAIVDAVRYVMSLDYQSFVRGTIEWLRSTLNAAKTWQGPIGGLDTYVNQMADALLAQLENGSGSSGLGGLPSASTILQSLITALSTTFRTAAGVLGTVFSSITLVLFTFLTSIYINLSAHTFHDAFLRSIPVRFRPEITILLARLARTWTAFFRGQLTLMLVIGVFTSVGLTILGVPGALYLGIVAGLLEVLPNLGPIIATIPAVIVALLHGSTYLPVSAPVFALIVILFYILVQQFENNLIVPRVLGDAVELPPLVVITGVLVGADVAGLLGALLATPVIASIREIARYTYLKILGENPYPPEKEVPAPSPRPSDGPKWWLNLKKSFRRPVSRESSQPDEQPGE
jgi:predicted PurR-regulated permease PerM